MYFLCLLAHFFIITLFFYSDLGVHVDGFISNIAQSFVVGATKVCLLLWMPQNSFFILLEVHITLLFF